MPSFTFSTSILPAHLSYIEYWAARFFLLLAFLTIGPWLFLILYDFLLYLFRVITFEIPYIGGRARGKTKPRAPSVSVRSDGRRRRFSLLGANAADEDEDESKQGKSSGLDGSADFQGQSRGVRRVLQEEERDMKSWEVVEDSDRDDGGQGR